MKNACSLESLLEVFHKQSGASQSALYFMAYPGYNNLIFCGSVGTNAYSERYWRPHLAEAETIKTIRKARSAFLLREGSLTKYKEITVAVPISHGEDVIGVVVHCYTASPPEDLSCLQPAVHEHVDDLFGGWVEFLIAEQSRPLSILFNIAGSISSSLDLDRVLLTVVEQATVLFRVKMSSLMMVNWKSRELEMITAYGCSLEYLDKPNVPIEGSILGRVIRENRVVQVENILEEQGYLHKTLAKKEGVASLLAAPVTFENEMLGVLNIYSALPRRWQRSEMELLQTFANHAAVAITNARVHKQVVSMEEQLQVSAKMATVGELAAGLAHEIRNPLAVINMLLHSWKSATPDPDDFADDLDVIADKIANLNALVSDLLNLARTRPLEKNDHNIAELVQRVLRLLNHRITQQKVQIIKEFHHGAQTLYIDRERIEQALLNVFLNALDVMPDGGEIRVSTQVGEGEMRIAISDTGPGVAEERRGEIFKAFRSFKPKGMGLGLPLTKRIVNEHKGEITVSSNVPHGAVFILSLPFYVENES